MFGRSAGVVSPVMRACGTTVAGCEERTKGGLEASTAPNSHSSEMPLSLRMRQLPGALNSSREVRV